MNILHQNALRAVRQIFSVFDRDILVQGRTRVRQMLLFSPFRQSFC